MRKTTWLLTILLAFVSFKVQAQGEEVTKPKDVTLTLSKTNTATREAMSDALTSAIGVETGEINLVLKFESDVENYPSDIIESLSGEAAGWLKELLKGNDKANITGVDISNIGIYPIFEGNGYVKSVKLPDLTGKDIPENMFYGCVILETLTVGNNITGNTTACAVKSIGNNAFRDCAKLNNLNFEMSGTLGNDVFRGCKSFTSIPVKPVKPAGQEGWKFVFGSYVFGECDGLENVTIPDDVTEIGENAFNGCANLKTLTLSNSVTTIKYNSIANCNSFTGFAVQDDNPSFSVAEGILYSKDGNTLILCPWTKNITGTSFTDITAIGEEAFRGCTNIGALSFPNLATLGNGAFRESSITSLTLPSTVTINNNQFIYDCAKLTKIETTGEDGNVVAKGGILYKKEGETYTLFACPAALSFTSSAINVLKTGHYDKESKSITITETLTDNVLDLFNIEKELNNVNVTKVAEGAFYKNQTIETLVLPDNVNGIADQAFNECRLKYLAVPYNLTTYGVCIMVLCTDFTAYVVDERSQDVTNEANWVKIGDITYYPLKNFSVGSLGVLYDKDYSVMYSVPAQYVPANDEGLVKTYDNIRRIHSCCFRNTKNIKMVFFSQGIMDIPHQCFLNSDVEKVIIPNSVVRLGQDMFRSTQKLKDVYFLTTSSIVAKNQSGNSNIFYGYNPPAGAKFHFSEKYPEVMEAYKSEEGDNGFKSLIDRNVVDFNNDIKHRVLFESDNEIIGFNSSGDLNNEGKFVNDVPIGYSIKNIRDDKYSGNILEGYSGNEGYEYITLYRDFKATTDDQYNTLALPFSITRKQMREKFEMLNSDKRAKVYKFVGRKNNVICFETIDLHIGDDNEIVAKAGEAVLIKPTRKRHTYLFEFDLTNPNITFDEITKDKTTSENNPDISVTTADNTARDENGEELTGVEFIHGFYATYCPNQEVGPYFYYVTADGKVMYATKKRNITKAFRGYIFGNESTYGTESLAAAKAMIDIDGIATGLDEINIDGVVANRPCNVYSIDGRLIRKDTSSTDGLPKGIYVVNGRKVAVK